MFRRTTLFGIFWRFYRVGQFRLLNSSSFRSHFRYWLRWRPQLLVALTAGFSFQESGIQDHAEQPEYDENGEQTFGWETIYDECNMKVLRKPLRETGLYEYRCSGVYRDITPRDFIDAQLDIDYRKKWDCNIVDLELLYSDDETNSEVIRWISKFPYPMYPREYVYLRRRYIDYERRCVTIASSSVPSDVVPVSGNYVRVEEYRSSMIVKAHGKFDEKGLDFILVYYDNPESNIPRYAYNWILTQSGPYFLKQVHAAALELERQRNAKQEETNESLVGSVFVDECDVFSETEMSAGDEEEEDVKGTTNEEKNTQSAVNLKSEDEITGKTSAIRSSAPSAYENSMLDLSVW
ncbi:hypothetical protein AB6A40_007326 [Gnathostoma spinigerum]|uniref:Phosphatidylcholine transfer protein n=1 Tax=Gnathostoma spinigerum TaxID=75299 RepID=A0ABD6EVL8_9BILA